MNKALCSSNDRMSLLSCLLLSPAESETAAQAAEALRGLTREDFEALLALAGSNHVLIRGMEVIQRLYEGANDERAAWASAALDEEHARIATAIGYLHQICDAFVERNLDVTVMKSLDHWPDLGSDLDLYSNASPQAVCSLMTERFGAQIAPRSWGDRLACKWNFEIPGLPESVEVHVGRLGQTGEQLVLASRLPSRARTVEMGGYTFRVPSASDRLMISTLQRMYRHFYFRLCDIVDSAWLVGSGLLDFSDLRASAQAAGIWEGVATYLVIVSDYVRQYRGTDLGLPQLVKDAARFGGNLVYFSRDFLRVPIMPQSASLYGTQLSGLLRKGELYSSARLGLLPWLATAAAVGQKLTGSDKGIW
ncbi:MAG TPA: hypothetical protein VJS11_14400 [Acidobacteriaceae bacterium]|nr:hypothetical protein [Acidobacteriaceae bacterium]